MKLFLQQICAFATITAMLGTSAAVANPSGASVIAGSATLQGGAGSLTIHQLSDRGIINWQSFSIGAGETTSFLQPSASSALLNRVTGGDMSTIMGSLKSNGQIYLINPNGILMGKGSRIDTNGFVASTLDVDNGEFMAGGDLKFFGTSKSKVTNLGTINAKEGDIFLIGAEVENAGTLNAPKGTVGLGAGHNVLLKRSGDERLFVDPTAEGNDGKVTNTAAINAARVELKANGGNLYGLAINNTGVIRATGVAKVGGRILLTSKGGVIQNSGKLIAKNADGSGGYVRLHSGKGGKTIHSGVIDVAGAKGTKGGRVELLGETIEVKTTAVINASGGTRGGTVLIGGDQQGKNPDIFNATNVTVEKGAAIHADALESGDGGKVIVWANGATSFEGTITARGGVSGGDGGFAEVSGKGSLMYQGLADLSAASGKLGTLLLDPTDVVIHEGTGTDDINNLYQANLEAQVADIVIQADNSITATPATVNVPFTLTLTPDVSMQMKVGAGGTIDLSQVILVAKGTGGFTIGDSSISSSGINISVNDISAGSGGIAIFGGITKLFGASVTANKGAITMNSTGNFGEVHLQQDTTIASNGGLMHFGAQVMSESGQGPFSLTVDSSSPTTSGDVTFEKTVSLHTLSVTGGNITTNDLIATTGDVTFTAEAGKTITFNDTIESGNGTETFITDHLVLGTVAGTYFGTSNSGATNTLNLKPATAGVAMAIGGTGGGSSSLNITSTQGSELQFANENFGNTGDGTIALHSASLTNATINGLVRNVDGSVNGKTVVFAAGGTTNMLAGGAVNTSGGAITFNGALNIASGATAQIESDNGNTPGGDITFSSTIDGPGDLTIIAGGGALTFSDTIGSTTALGNLSLFAQGIAISLPATNVTNVLNVFGNTVNTVKPLSIAQTGLIQASVFNGRSAGGIDLSNAANKIHALGTVTFGTDFHLNNSVDLLVDGSITGGASSNVTIEDHGGSISMMAAGGGFSGAKITIQGAGNNLVLASDIGVFNNVGSTVLDAQSGSRWVIYVTANDATHLKLNGLNSTFTNTTVTFPTLPADSGNGIVIGAITGAPTGIQGILIVSGLAGSGADDSLLDDNQVLFTDAGSGATITISEGKLESLSGNILLQATQSITLSNGVNLDLTGVLAGDSFKLQTSAGGAQITLDGDVTTGGGGITMQSPAGTISTKGLASAGGDVSLTGNGETFTSISAGAGTVTLHAAFGSIVDAAGTTPDITAAKLAIFASTGIGLSGNVLNTSVSNIEAETSTGGIFITNSGHAVTIGGVDSGLNGLSAGAGKIQIINDSSILVTDFAETERVFGQSDIMLEADGGSSDIVLGDSTTAVNAHSGAITLQAGRDIDIGNGISGKSGDLGSNATININAGHAVVVDEDSVIAGDLGVNITAGTVVSAPDARPSSIVFQKSHTAGARIATRGGDVNLTTAGAGFVDLHSGNTTSDVATTLTTGQHGNINFKTDDANIGDNIDAGASDVTFTPATTGKAFDLGTDHPANTGNYPSPVGTTFFSLTNAELNRISAANVQIGNVNVLGVSDFSAYGNITVSAPISVAGTKVGAFFMGGAQFAFGSSFSAENAYIGTDGNINGAGAINIVEGFALNSKNQAISLTGDVSADTLEATAKKSLTIVGGVNHINTLENMQSTGNGAFVISVIDADGGLNIDGQIGQSILSPLTVAIETTGNLTITSSGQVNGGLVTLAANNGLFINSRGSDAIVAGRFLVYAKDNSNNPNNRNGLVAAADTDDHFNLTLGEDPVQDKGGSDNAFYYFGSKPLPPGLARAATITSFSQQDAITLLALQEGQPASVVTQFVVQNRAYGGTVPPKSPDEVFLGWNPAALAASADLQEAYKGNPESLITELDVELMLAGGGLAFTPAQVPLLSPDNKFYLAYLGYQKMIADGSLQDPDGAIKAGIMNWMPDGLAGAKTIIGGFDLPAKLLAAGPMTVTRTSSTELVFANLFNVSDKEVSVADAPPKSAIGKSVQIFPPAGLPIVGSSVLVPSLAGAGVPLILANGMPILGSDGLPLFSLSGGTIISHDSGGIISHDSGGIISHDSGGIISHDSGGIISHDSGGIISHDSGGIISHDSGGLIAPAEIISHDSGG